MQNAECLITRQAPGEKDGYVHDAETIKDGITTYKAYVLENQRINEG